MNEATKAARQRLKDATRQEWDTMIYKAGLTEEQISLLEKHIHLKKTCLEIGEEFCYCERKVAKELKKCYERIARII